MIRVSEQGLIYQSLVESRRSLLPSNPRQAFKNASRALRCLFRLLMTSVPGSDVRLWNDGEKR